jgi:hypothetical protein
MSHRFVFATMLMSKRATAVESQPVIRIHSVLNQFVHASDRKTGKMLAHIFNINAKTSSPYL